MGQSFAEQLRSIPMSPSLGQSLERAHRCARDQSHRLVTLEHLLLALTEDAEAALILQSANVDLARLGTDVSGYLGRLMEDMRAEPGTEPRPDAELLRVLQAAASAAQQSRRKQIDGAIVLAAIVGDGKSPAAGLLKSLGMTFEEAIRALQRANTKARLKPLAKAPAASPPAPEASPAPSPGSADQGAAPADPGGGHELPITEPGTVPQASATQSADEILAAARARIQKRSAAAARTEPASPRAPPSSLPPAPGPAPSPGQLPPQASVGGDRQTEPVAPAQTQSLTAAIEAAMVPPSARMVEPHLPPAAPAVAAQAPELAPPVASAPSAPSRAARTPPLEAKPQPQEGLTRLPLPPAARAPSPFPARPLPPHEGPRRPPLPGGGASPAQPGFRPAPAPWPEPEDRAQTGRPPLANGSYGELSVPERAGLAPRRVVQRAGMPGEKGLLIEAVPRRMRVGVAASAEVRIARDKIDGLLLALKNRDAQPPGDPPVARALSVRLRGTKGGFWVESTTPETQWVVDSRPLRTEDDHIAWRWTVVPRRRGRNRLTVMVTVHTAGRDGTVATTSPPDRVIDVSVRLNRLRRAARVTGWILAGLAGAALARFGLQYWPLVAAIFKNVLG